MTELERRDAIALAHQHAREALATHRVFGEPIERGDVTIIPVASVQGGAGGGGGGEGPDGGGSGSGGGFGMRARPVGVYVVKDGHVRFEPALDLNRVIAGGQVLAAIGLLTLRRWLKRRKRG